MLVDSRVIRNHILLVVVKRIGLPYRQKENLYPLIIILGGLIAYREVLLILKQDLFR